MVFTIAFLTRPTPGMALEQFFTHYVKIHRPLAEQLPGLLSYRQTRILKDGYRGDDAIDYAAFSEYTFPDEATAMAAWQSPEAAILNEDAMLFMDWSSVRTIPLAELGTFQSDRTFGLEDAE